MILKLIAFAIAALSAVVTFAFLRLIERLWGRRGANAIIGVVGLAFLTFIPLIPRLHSWAFGMIMGLILVVTSAVADRFL